MEEESSMAERTEAAEATEAPPARPLRPIPAQPAAKDMDSSPTEAPDYHREKIRRLLEPIGKL